MKYDALSRNTVKITLSEEDMKEYALCAENIVSCSPETKAELTRLLKETKLFGKITPERLFLEVFPKNGGGCVLYVSSLEDETETDFTPLSEKDNIHLMCSIGRLDTLICLCKGLKAFFPEAETSVYRNGNFYVAVVEVSPKKAGRMLHFLAEYGDATADKSEISAIGEYAVLISSENTAEKFSRLS